MQSFSLVVSSSDFFPSSLCYSCCDGLSVRTALSVITFKFVSGVIFATCLLGWEVWHFLTIRDTLLIDVDAIKCVDVLF